jgi:hypothetical protein
LLYRTATLGVPSTQRQFLREVLYGCCWQDNEFDRACSTVWWEKARDNAEERLNRPLEPRQLEHWLDHWAVRQILGNRRKEIYQHLMQRQNEQK